MRLERRQNLPVVLRVLIRVIISLYRSSAWRLPFMRNVRSLSGTWQFQFDPEGSLTLDSLSPDREITVPLPWQAAFPEYQQYSGYAWYRRAFDVEEEWLGGELLLHFGAVDYWCEVFVNGQSVGTHEGGYMPF